MLKARQDNRGDASARSQPLDVTQDEQRSDDPADRARAVLGELRTAVAAILAAIPNMPERAVDLSRELKLDRSLAWKLHRVALGNDTLPASQHIPGRRGFGIFLDAAAGSGVDDALISRARAAFDAFGRLASALGGDRATGDIVLSEFSEEGRDRRDLSLRRALIRANSQLLGVQASHMRQVSLALPGPIGSSPTYYQLRGFYGFRCLREGATWTFGRVMVVTSPDMRPALGPVRTPLEPGRPGESPLVARFCAGHDLAIRRREVVPGIFEDEILPAPIGSVGTRDIVLGERIGSLPSPMSADAVTTNVVLPLERLTVELYLHRSLVTASPPSLQIYTTVLDPTPWANQSHRDQLPIAAELKRIRATSREKRTGQRDAQLEYLSAAACVPLTEFVGHRLDLRFPPMPCCVMMSYALPNRLG